MPGTADKIIASLRSTQSEKARIAMGGADHRYRDLRIENSLPDGNGDEARLKKGAQVEVALTAKPKK
jgi:hypothetical protein